MSKTFGAGILAIDKSTGRILLGRRGLKGSEPNTWVPFGGTLEPNDNVPKRTAIREFREESGCKCRFKISKKPFYINESNHVKFYTYLGVFDKQFLVKINNESIDYDWFDINHMPENLHPGFEELLNNKLDVLKKIIAYLMN